MPKELSVLTVSEKPSSDLYWKQYVYCVHIQQSEIGILRRSRDAVIVAAAINKQQDNERKLWYPGFDRRLIQNVEQAIADIHATAVYLENINVPHKLVFYSHDRLRLYTNNAEFIDTLQIAAANTVLPVKITAIKKCLLVLPQDTIMLNNPTHRFRTYFKDRAMTNAANRGRLVAWIQEQESAKEIAASPSVKRWIIMHSQRSPEWFNYGASSHWYIDHNNKSYETMLSLVYPGLVRKTVNLQRR